MATITVHGAHKGFRDITVKGLESAVGYFAKLSADGKGWDVVRGTMGAENNTVIAVSVKVRQIEFVVAADIKELV